MLKLFSIPLAVLLLATPSFAQESAPSIIRLDGSKITAAEIDHTVKHLLSKAEVTGAGIAILNNGKIAFIKGYGFRDKDKDLPLTADTVMSAASFSKVAFAFLVMQLVGDGVIDLDNPIYKYLPKPLPEYPKYADLAGDPRWQRITARMLLSHTSGFPNWRAFEDDRKLKIHFEPGSRYAYSGEGIDLLQLVVETVTRKPLGGLMQERLFGPLQMSRTSMVWQEQFESDFANGYDEYGRDLGPQKRTAADAAGSMLTTTGDFARFLQAVAAAKLLRRTVWEQMLSPQVQIRSRHQFPTFSEETTEENAAIRLSYGLGWGLYTTPVGKAFFKEGHDDGWRNYAVCFEPSKIGLVVMTNSSNGEGIFKELLETLLKNPYTPIEWEGYTPYDKLPPRPPLRQHKTAVVDPKLLDRYVGRYGQPPDLILTIRREGDHLSIQENDEPKQHLLAESDADFYSTTSSDSLTFETDPHGRVARFILHADGRDISVNRID